MKVLVIRFGSLGDLVLTLPVIQALHAAGAAVDVLTKRSFSGLFEGDPRLRRIHALSEQEPLRRIVPALKRERYDLVVDLHANLRSRWVCLVLERPTRRIDKAIWARRRLVRTRRRAPSLERHTVDRGLEALGPLAGRNPNRLPQLQPTSEEASFADTYMGSDSTQRRIAIHPLAQHATKQWPRERFVETADCLLREGWAIHWIGAPFERGAIAEFQSAMKGPSRSLTDIPDLRRLGAVLGRMEVVLTGDSGPMHLAVAAGTRVVALFGSTHPALGFSPLGPYDTVLQVDRLDCRPCHLHGRPACPLKHFDCMNGIPVERVIGAVRNPPSK